MDLTHLHLLITHLPIYGSILGSLVLFYGILAKSKTTRLAGYYVLVISAIGGIIAFSTGEHAEETVEEIQGIAKTMIEEHEEFAERTLIAIIAMGVTALAGIFFTLRNATFAKAVAVIVLVTSLICFSMAAWTGYLGGQIRHTEVNPANVSTPAHNNTE